MRLSLNILTAFLHSLKPRKLLSSSRNTYLPNIFSRHNPRFAARAARLRATKSASRIRVSAAPSITSINSRNGGAHHHHHQRRQRNRLSRSLKRNNSSITNIIPTQVPSYPQPPGAYASAPPAPNDFLNTDDPLVAQKVFFDALYKQRTVLLRAADERREAAEAEARQHSAEENAEYLRLLAEDQRKAQEALRRAEEEAAEERRLQEEMEAQERRRRREERRRRHAERRERARREQERLERERLEQIRREQEQVRRERERRWREQERLEEVRREQERREQERHEQERQWWEQERRWREQEALRQQAAAEAVALEEQVSNWHRYYEEKWALLRSDVQFPPLAFSDIPWPLFGVPCGIEDIAPVRVQEFLCHSERESVQGTSLAKSLRSEMLRWHPDKFDAKVLNKVMEGHREVVKEAAGRVARILTQLTTELQGR